MSAFNSGSVVTNFSGTLSTLQLTGNTPTTSTNTGTLIVGGGIGAQAINVTSETTGDLRWTRATGGMLVIDGPSSGSMAALQVSGSAQLAPKIVLTGTDYAFGDTGQNGISLLLHVSTLGNKELGIIDTNYVGSGSSTVPILRLSSISGKSVIDSIAGDGFTPLPLYCNSSYLPYSDNAYTLGSSANRWSNLSAVKSTFTNLMVTSTAFINSGCTVGGLYVSNDIRSSIPNYYQWYATGTSNYQTIASGQLTVIAQFTGANSAGNLYGALVTYSGITSVFYTGTHFVSANIRFSANATGYRQVLFYQNVQLAGGTFNVTGGTLLAEAVIPVNSGSVVTTVALSAIVQLNAADTISVVVQQNSGSNINLDGSAQNNFSIHRIA